MLLIYQVGFLMTRQRPLLGGQCMNPSVELRRHVKIMTDSQKVTLLESRVNIMETIVSNHIFFNFLIAHTHLSIQFCSYCFTSLKCYSVYINKLCDQRKFIIPDVVKFIIYKALTTYIWHHKVAKNRYNNYYTEVDLRKSNKIFIFLMILI